MAKAKAKLKEKKAKAGKAYDANALVKLEFPEAPRLRIGMYFGSKEEAGVRRGWKEILDNSVDESQNGHGNKITCCYNSKKKLFLVADQGRGVPSGWNTKEKMSGFEIVFATLHGSGKFDTSNYASSSGLNGCGAAIAQAVASSFQVWSHNEGVWKTQTFAEGYATSKVMKGAPEERFAKTKQGTVVQWVPDKKVFGDAVVDTDKMLETCQSLAMLNPGLELVVVIDGTKTVYKSEHGLLDMIYGTPEQKQLTLGKPFHFQSKGLLDIAVSWQDSDVPNTKAFVNSSYTPEEGTHVQGARNAIVEALRSETDSSKKSVKPIPGKRGKAKQDKDAPLDGKFLMMGMQLAMNWRMKDPVYSGQTKDKLTNAEVTAKVKAVVLPEFSKFLKQNPKLISMLLDRAKKFQKAADKFQQDLSAVKSIKLAAPSTRGLLPQKLAQHRGKCKPEEVELFLVEGESAAGPAKEVRLPFQEVLELRGKLLNAERATFPSMLNSPSVMGIIISMGAKPGDECRTSGGTVRIGRINIMTDADPDGDHICSLLIALFAKYFPQWIEEGRISHIFLPLFVGALGEQKDFGFTRDELLEKFPAAKRKNVIVNHLKGLGEMTGSELFTFGMDPKTRRCKVFTMSDVDLLEVKKIMGKDDEHKDYRKEILGITAKGAR